MEKSKKFNGMILFIFEKNLIREKFDVTTNSKFEDLNKSNNFADYINFHS